MSVYWSWFLIFNGNAPLRAPLARAFAWECSEAWLWRSPEGEFESRSFLCTTADLHLILSAVVPPPKCGANSVWSAWFEGLATKAKGDTFVLIAERGLTAIRGHHDYAKSAMQDSGHFITPLRPAFLCVRGGSPTVGCRTEAITEV